ncbi:Syntaxin binding protein [Plasmodium coatneyi]|uniref:Syntaxin binding protein n=1 Tax=Plasmodium coatneyi TaxID=208452 RepID=A0A1B1E2F2_9APIC|nr:Syntaxin binding protein [Plasmodium coatneyi]ANQ09173.1 Syntaxin binding protein [Plasmodium coatneyi]
MSLKRNCRERLFSVIEKITQVSKYVIMVVDPSAQQVLSMICKSEELLERGVSLVEQIDAKRNRLQDFDCMYFLSSTVDVVESVLEDFKDEQNAMYKNVHILFTSNVGKKNREILDLLATSDLLLKRMKTCACFNIPFFAFESRVFYFNHELNLYDFYPVKDSSILADLALELLSVCACLKSNPLVRYLNSPLCRKFAEIFYNSVSDSNILQKSDGKDEEDVLLILDRSVDSSILFAHDYSYQSLCYDVLRIRTHQGKQAKPAVQHSVGSTNQGDDAPHTVRFEITNNDQRKEVKKATLSEEDNLWVKYRHTHIQDVNEMVKNDIASFTEKNAVAKIKKKNVLNPNEALDALRSLPQYETMIEQYWLHVYLCDNCFQILQKKNVVEVGMVEQDLCCNVDNYGKELTHTKNSKNVVSILSSDDYQQEEKARLLLLYFINYENVSELDKARLIEESQVGLLMENFIHHFLSLKIHCDQYGHLEKYAPEESSSTGSKVSHILERNRKKIKHYKDVAKNAKYELSRYEPNVRDIIVELHEDTLHRGQFPFVDGNRGSSQQVKDQNTSEGKKTNVTRGTVWGFKSIERKDTQTGSRKKIIIFILGGITFPEIRQAYELSEQLDVDVYLGGTSLLTSEVLFQQFRRFPGG